MRNKKTPRHSAQRTRRTQTKNTSRQTRQTKREEIPDFLKPYSKPKSQPYIPLATVDYQYAMDEYDEIATQALAIKKARDMRRSLREDIEAAQWKHRIMPFITAAAAIVAIIVILVVFVLPNVAFAATSDEIKTELQDAKTELNRLYEETEAVSEELNKTISELETTKANVQSTQDEARETNKKLNELQGQLRRRVRSNYKSGDIDLIEIVLSCSTFEEFTEAVKFATHISDNETATIKQTNELRQQLSEQLDNLQALQQQQQQLVDEQDYQQRQLQAAAAEQESYVANLDEKLQEQLRIEEEERKEAERKAREEAERKEQERQAELERQQQQEQQPAETTTPTTPQSTDERRQTLVNCAKSQLGLPYIWGGKTPGVGMDCSGLVSWCYDQIGIHMPHYHASIAEYVRERRSVEELEPGDVVLWMGGDGSHVAMYIGNYQIIEEIYRGCSINNIYDRMPYTFAGTIL